MAIRTDIGKTIGRIRAGFAEALALIRDRNLTVTSRCWKVFRLVCRFFGATELLSDRIPSTRDISRRRMEGAGPLTLRDLYDVTLHRFHTFGASTGIFLATLIGLTLLPVAFDRLTVATMPTSMASQSQSIGNSLLTASQVLAGVTGLLFAIIVFGVQFHGERLGRLAFLMRYLRRRQGFLPIAAIALGVCAANVIVPLIAPFGLTGSNILLAILDVVVIPAVLILTIRLLYDTAVSASDDALLTVLPGLQWEFERALDEDEHTALIRNEYEALLTKAGLRYRQGAAMLGFDEERDIVVALDRVGRVIDVEVAALNSLAVAIKSLGENVAVELCVAPGDDVRDGAFAIISARSSRDPKPNVDKKVIAAIKDALWPMIRVSSASERDIGSVMNDLAEALAQQVQYEPALNVERSLEVFRTLITSQISRKSRMLKHRLFSDDVPSLASTIPYWRMAQIAVGSKDSEKIQVLLMFAVKLMHTAISELDPSVFERAGQIVEALYLAAIQAGNFADAVGKEIDDWVLKVGDSFDFCKTWRADHSRSKAERPVVLASLRWHMRLIRLAVEAGRTKDAKNFLDRLTNWHSISIESEQRTFHRRSEDVALIEINDLHYGAILVLATWCFHRARGTTSDSTAAELLGMCIAKLPSRHDVLRVWESLNDTDGPVIAITQLYDVQQWTAPPVGRTGIYFSYGQQDRWALDGFIALLLARPPARRYEIDPRLQAPPARHPITADQFNAVFESIRNEPGLPKLLTIAPESVPTLIAEAAQLLKERLTMFRRMKLYDLLDAPLSEDQCAKLNQQINSAVLVDGEIASILNCSNSIDVESFEVAPQPVECNMAIPKRALVQTQSNEADIADHIANDLLAAERIHVLGIAEISTAHRVIIEQLDDLRDAVQREIAVLELRNLHPNVVLIPDQEHIVRALTGLSPWELPNNGMLGDLDLGEWGPRRLIRWPHFDCKSIVILDTRAFYARLSNAKNRTVAVSYADSDAVAVEKIKAQAASETDPQKITDPFEIRVLVTASTPAQFGVRQASAGARINLDASKLGLAMRQSDNKFHLPHCKILQGAKDVKYAFFPRLPSDDGPRDSCDQCNPHEWNPPPRRRRRPPRRRPSE